MIIYNFLAIKQARVYLHSGQYFEERLRRLC